MKWARLLSKNQIQEIIMDSDSGEEKYYASEDMEDDEELRPPSRQSSISQPPSPDFSASSSEDEDGLAMWQVNSHNPLCGHCPLNPKGM